MILTWKKRKRIVIAVALTIFASAFFLAGNQRQVQAVINPDLGNLGGEIVCFVFSQLNAVGTPIPVLSAGDCQNPPSAPAQCIDGIDNDGDGLVDFPADLGCTSVSDNTEAPNPTPPPSPPPPAVTQCSDGIDNDGDGKIDMVDSGCSSTTDNDETDPPSSDDGGDDGNGDDGGGSTPTPPADSGQADSGSSRGGRSGGSSRPVTPLQGKVLGVEVCEEYLLEYIKFGGRNNSNEVLKLQRFLRDLGGFVNLKETGVYDAATLAAVHEFQKVNAAQILTPWGATRSTGYVYYTTKKVINEIHCKFIRKFPLNSEQEQEIERVKTFGKSWRAPNSIPLAPPLVPTPKNIKSSVPNVLPIEQPEVGGSPAGREQSASVEAGASSAPTGGWFSGLLNWLRVR